MSGVGASHAVGMREHREKPALPPFLGWKASLPTPAAGAEMQEKDTPQFKALQVSLSPPSRSLPSHRCLVKQLMLSHRPHPTPGKMKFYSRSPDHEEKGAKAVSFGAAGKWDKPFPPSLPLCSARPQLPLPQEAPPGTQKHSGASDCPGTG